MDPPPPPRPPPKLNPGNKPEKQNVATTEASVSPRRPPPPGVRPPPPGTPSSVLPPPSFPTVTDASPILPPPTTTGRTVPAPPPKPVTVPSSVTVTPPPPSSSGTSIVLPPSLPPPSLLPPPVSTVKSSVAPPSPSIGPPLSGPSVPKNIPSVPSLPPPIVPVTNRKEDDSAYNTLVQSRDDAFKERDQAIKDYETLKSTLDNTIVRNEELLGSLAQMEVHQGALETERASLEKRCESLSAQITKVTLDKESILAELNEQTKVNDTLSNELQNLKETNTTMNASDIANNNRTEELQRALTETQQLYHDQQERCKLLTIQIATLEKENHEIRSEAGAQTTTFEHYEHDILQQLKTLENMKAEQDKVYEDRISKLETEIHEQERTFENKLKMVHEQKEAAEIRFNDTLTKQEKEAVEAVGKVREEYDTMIKDTTITYQEEKELLLRQLTELQNKLTNANNTATNVASDETNDMVIIGKLEGQLLVTKQELEQTLRNQTLQAKEFEKQSTAYQTTIDLLRKEKEAVQDQYLQCQEQLQQAKEENNALRTQLAIATIDKQTHEGENSVKVLGLEKEIQGTKEIIAQLNVRNDEFGKTMDELRTKHSQAMQAREDNYAQQLSKLHADYGQQLTNLRTEYDQQINQLKDEYSKLSTNYRTLETNYNQRGNDIENLQQEITKTNEQMSALKEEYKVLLNAHTSLLASVGNVNPQSLLNNLPEIIKKEIFHHNTPLVVNLSAAATNTTGNATISSDKTPSSSSSITISALSEEQLWNASMQANAITNQKKVVPPSSVEPTEVPVVTSSSSSVGLSSSLPEPIEKNTSSLNNTASFTEDDVDVVAGAMHLAEALAHTIDPSHSTQQQEAERIMESHEVGAHPASVWVVHSRTPQAIVHTSLNGNEGNTGSTVTLSPSSITSTSGWVGTRYVTGYPSNVVPPIYKHSSPSSKAQVLEKLRQGNASTSSPNHASVSIGSKANGHFLVKSPVPANVAQTNAKKYPSPKSPSSSSINVKSPIITNKPTTAGTVTMEGRAKRANL